MKILVRSSIQLPVCSRRNIFILRLCVVLLFMIFTILQPYCLLYHAILLQARPAHPYCFHLLRRELIFLSVQVTYNYYNSTILELFSFCTFYAFEGKRQWHILWKIAGYYSNDCQSITASVGSPDSWKKAGIWGHCRRGNNKKRKMNAKANCRDWFGANDAVLQLPTEKIQNPHAKNIRKKLHFPRAFFSRLHGKRSPRFFRRYCNLHQGTRSLRGDWAARDLLKNRRSR